MNNKATTVCFSGHRVFQDPTADIEKKLDKAVRDCISKGAECFITGGALGFDTLAARTVIRLRKEFPQIKLILALPCPPQAQTLKWSAPQVAEYREILGLADDVRILSQTYTQSCMLDRNRYMVDNSSTLIHFFPFTRPLTAAFHITELNYKFSFVLLTHLGSAEPMKTLMVCFVSSSLKALHLKILPAISLPRLLNLSITVQENVCVSVRLLRSLKNF